MDNEIWRWLWTFLAIVLGVGELFTAGFFLLPFSIGAGAAAVLAWLGANLLAQWLVFFGVTVASLAYLRRFIGRQDEGEQPRVGANRWIGSSGVGTGAQAWRKRQPGKSSAVNHSSSTSNIAKSISRGA